MNVRRSAAVLAALGVLAAAAPAMAADPSPSASPKVTIPSGLFGKADPTYDGVWRQSLALLAQRTLGYRPADSAVDWLVGQQCDKGGFAAFRADTAKPCEGKGGAQPDTNSTAAAVQALQAVGGHDAEVRKALVWLSTLQNKDGGWGYAPGAPSDTNSTGVVVGAFAAVGQDPAQLHLQGKNPYDLLAKWSLPCDGTGGGALAYQPDKKGKLVANADATAAGVLGALGTGFAAKAGKAPEQGYACANSDKPLTPAQVANNGSAYLGEAMTGDGYLKSVLPGAKDQPDYGNTADSVVALAANGWTRLAKKPYAWLEKNAVKWAEQSGPAAYAELVFAAHAMGDDPHDFGGTDLVRALNATGPAPQKAAATAEPGKRVEHDSGIGVWWIVGAGLVFGVGIGILLSGRRKRQQL
ncbi:prenyltransferase/squalene oxidase repeat-containing protein [Streptomyces diastatochromogenes]|uniref:prenyltransferase/squalene oxidase repeat-containing protein n=1 Tax=Streptomyces diastatochromogenes TaxID=42236 RepID=UPI00369CA79F